VNLFLPTLLRGLKTHGIHFGVALAAVGYVSVLITPSAAHAQTTPTRSKVIVKNNSKQTGIKAPRRPSQSLAPTNSSLVDTSKESDLASDLSNSLDFRVQRGCIKTDSLDGNLPARLGINDPVFFEFFQNQTRSFFSELRGNCIPYAVAFGKRNRFDSLSIMNGPIRDARTQILTFTPSAFGGFLTQEDRLQSQSPNLVEVELSLSDVLYDAKKVGDILPVELVWELNSIVKQLYPEDSPTTAINANQVRLIVDFGDRDRWAQIWAVEIMNTLSQEVLASAFWVDRNGIPGGFFTASGESIERSFWTNPLSYRRISRGVGSVRAGRAKAPAKQAGQAPATVQRWRTHMGIDYAAPTGTPVFSVANGKIAYLGYNGAFGNLIIVEHPGNYRTYYAHLSNYNVELSVGNDVRRGFEIGYVGSTGRSSGPHLHYELRRDGTYIDPYSPSMQLDLWSMRDSDSGQFTRQLLLLGSLPNNE
jgi:murein DD-endopeptidase MepM/ murein hydrolase activator NlpD